MQFIGHDRLLIKMSTLPASFNIRGNVCTVVYKTAIQFFKPMKYTLFSALHVLFTVVSNQQEKTISCYYDYIESL